MSELTATDRNFIKSSTPNPEELSFRVKVDANTFYSASLQGKEGATYASFPFSNKMRASTEGFSNYVYSGSEDAEPGFIWLWFAKNKTEIEKMTPFRETPNYEPWEWYPILLELIPVLDPLPRSSSVATRKGEGVASSTRYTWRRRYIPGGRYGSLYIVREYQAATKFDIPAYECPVPDDVYVEVPGSGDLTFPPCLHKAFSIVGLETGLAQVVDGEVSSLRGGVDAYRFPATNFTGWESYISDAQQNFDRGVWHMREILRIPPELPKAKTQ